MFSLGSSLSLCLKGPKVGFGVGVCVCFYVILVISM